ncbi:Zinc finger protein 343 [Manis javanica]|nr:Zinc finger protein 343 [Manis javanica]
MSLPRLCQDSSDLARTAKKALEKPTAFNEISHNEILFMLVRSPTPVLTTENVSARVPIYFSTMRFTREISSCGTTFCASSSLIKHQQIHSEEKPYICGECGKGFTVRSLLRAHQGVHNGLNSYIYPSTTRLWGISGSGYNTREFTQDSLCLKDSCRGQIPSSPFMVNKKQP